MSVKVTALCWRVKLPATAKLVLMRLADYSNDSGGSIYPAIGRVAEECGLSRRGVHTALKVLADAGLLEVVEASRGGRGRTSRYSLNLLKVVELGGGSVPDSGGPGSGMAGNGQYGNGAADAQYEATNSAADAQFSDPGNGAADAQFDGNCANPARNPAPPAPNPLESRTLIDERDSRAQAQAREVAGRIVVLAGMTPDPRREITPVEEWLAAGADPERDIYPAVHLVLSRTRQTEIRRFGFFAAEVENFRAARVNVPVKASVNVHPIRPAPQQRRGLAGRTAWRDQSLAYLASVIEDED